MTTPHVPTTNAHLLTWVNEIQALCEPDRVHWVVVGAGVNVNARREDFPEELRDEATSVLLERGQAAPRALLAAACFTALEEWLDRHAEEGFAPIREAWCERTVTLGREVLVKADGREIAGTAEDIDETGALLVRSKAGLERIVAGDVKLVRPG